MSRNGAATSSACTSRWWKAGAVPRSLLTKDFPQEKHDDVQYLVDALDWEGNVESELQGFALPRADSRRRHAEKEGYVDRWIVYGKFAGKQLFTAKELTVEPGRQVHDQGRRRLRLDHRPGRGPHRQAAAADARP